jgi:hypothetical protein
MVCHGGLAKTLPSRRNPIMSARRDDLLIEKLKSLPPEQRAEVEDFIDFLKVRRERARDEAARRLGEAFTKLDALNLPPMTPEEVQAEIDAARATRRQERS